MNRFSHHYQNYLTNHIHNWDKILENEFSNTHYAVKNYTTDCQIGLIDKSWDTNIFGFKVGELLIMGPPDGKGFLETLDNIISQCHIEQYKLLTVRLAYNAFNYIHSLENLGFMLVDCMNVFLLTSQNQHYNIKQHPLFSIEKYKGTSELTSQEILQIKSIACDAFTTGRIHNDENFTRENKIQFNEACAHSLIYNDKQNIIILRNKSNIIGFCIYGGDKRLDDASTLGYLWLIGIDNQFQGQGLGKQLLSYCLNEVKNAYKHFEIATQIDNYSALKIYSKLNLSFCSSIATFHRWL